MFKKIFDDDISDREVRCTFNEFGNNSFRDVQDKDVFKSVIEKVFGFVCIAASGN